MGLVAMPERHDDPAATDLRPTRCVPPVPRPRELKGFDGKWVAVAGHEIVASAETSHELARKLRSKAPDQLREIVIQYVRPTTDSYLVGAG